MKQILQILTTTTLTAITLTLTVSVSQVLDGDSLWVTLPTGEEVQLGLPWIDSMEFSQKGGEEALNHLESLTSPVDTLEVEKLSEDRFGPIVGTAKTQSGMDIPLEMVKQGHAVPYYFYFNECPKAEAILAAEKEAKENDRGIWGSGTKYFPWVFRRSRCLESAR